jgi:biotin operon repressor
VIFRTLRQRSRRTRFERVAAAATNDDNADESRKDDTNENDSASSGGHRLRPLRSASLISSLEGTAAESAAELLASCRSLSLSTGAVHRPPDTREETLLLLEEGFIVVHSVAAAPSRPMITCEAAYGGIVLPPAAQELLEAILDSRLTLLPAPIVTRLLALPALADAILREVSETLRRKQDSIANFGNVRHVERVRRKLVQLARDYGRVTSDGIKLDLPLTHALLGEMVGSERETVTRAIYQLEREGFLNRQGHYYRLLVSPDALTATGTTAR